MNKINQLKDIIFFVKNPKVYLAFGIVIFIIVLVIFLLNRQNNKWLRKISIPMIIVSIPFILMKLMTNTVLTLAEKVTDKTSMIVLNPFIKNLLSGLFKYGLILFGIGLLLLIIYIVLIVIEKKRSKK